MPPPDDRSRAGPPFVAACSGPPASSSPTPSPPASSPPPGRNPTPPPLLRPPRHHLGDQAEIGRAEVLGEVENIAELVVVLGKTVEQRRHASGGEERLSGLRLRDIVHAQIKAFCAVWERLDLKYARSKNLTSYDVLRIASMIEREAAAPVERPLVSAVIYNRLHLRMPLGIDATLRYGLNIAPTQSILQSQLESSNPFNTRRFAGLPPTPIASPGLASIEAAAHPAKVNYIYYARKPGTNRQFFTASQAAFNQFLAANGYGAH